ncbi:MAG: DNA-directed RNA polymerase subunit beta [Firmicutes bacterium]|nr:DNA-directed RNA polymerase subunit beta [Bacillota bacterium]
MRKIVGDKPRERRNYARIPDVMPMPNLIDVQTKSYQWFLEKGLKEIFADVSPITDFTGNLVLEFVDYSLGEPKYSIKECRDRDATYAAPLRVKVRLINKYSGEVKEQEIFMGDLPLMTDHATFIINGANRVIVSQLVRSPGVYFHQTIDPSGIKLYGSTVIPNRGAWLELETDLNEVIYTRIDRMRKMPVTVLLRALGYSSDEDIYAEFGEHRGLKLAIEKDPTKSTDEALIELYKRLRPGDPPTVESATALLHGFFFDERRYDFAGVGRYKVEKKLHNGVLRKMNEEGLVWDDEAQAYIESDEKPAYNDYIKYLTKPDIVATIKYFLELMDGQHEPDDIDHLGNRRLRCVGELLQNQFRIGLVRMERVVRERMTIQDADVITPSALVNIRPVVAAVKEFFGSSQLSQFMDQTNPLAELTHKRRLSALGPGGLSRERAGFEVRDVHHSHYGRMCPIETPEGPNIGLIGSLSSYARVNEFGFIETPYRRVENCRVLDQIDYLAADEEDKYVVAQANEPLDENGCFINARLNVRHGADISTVPAEQAQYMDVSPRQLVSVATALIPFLEHDDANRALMGANMQRQAVPLLVPEAPLVGTGMEYKAAIDSFVGEKAVHDGIIERVTADEIIIRTDEGDLERHDLLKYQRSNQSTCINQKPIVKKGQKVKAGTPIADGPATDLGELALGRNVLVAYMTWEGYNYEDAILLSQRLVKDDYYTSIHIEEYECEARDTKLGPEDITRDIPNVGDDALINLDADGIIRVGAEVKPGDILVGKVTPKGETELTAEERLLRAIFGEKAREVRDTSLRTRHGESGIVVDVKEFTRENGDELSPGVNKLVRIYLAQKRKISVGDKMAGRHGNKGVVSRILPVCDMPFLPDGTPVDIVLNPLGVPSRMNIGQILECHLGKAAHELGIHIATPVFDGATETDIADTLKEAGFPVDGKSILYDGRTGLPFDNPITTGYTYMLKLHHLVDDKIHARSTGPYSLVTQQPLGGKAQFGGQRFGEMEVWALEAYGAAYTLQEMLTVKSDDIVGRVKTYEAIVKGENVPEAGVPESFRVLIKELQSLCLDVNVLSADNEIIEIREDDDDDDPRARARSLELDSIAVGDEEAAYVASLPSDDGFLDSADEEDEDDDLDLDDSKLEESIANLESLEDILPEMTDIDDLEFDASLLDADTMEDSDEEF